MRKTGIPMPIRTKHIVVATEQSRKETILAVAVQQTEGISRSQEDDHSSRRRSGTCSSYALTNYPFSYTLWTHDDAHRALPLSGRLLQTLRDQRQQTGVTELVHGNDRRARLHRSANESLATRELDHLLLRLVDVHSGDSVHHHGAGALCESLAEIGIRGGHAAYPLEDGGVERNHEGATRGERVG